MSKLTEFFTRSSKQAPSNGGMIVGRLNGSIITPTGVISASNAMTNSDIYSIVSLISSDIGSMNFKAPDPVQQALVKPSDYINSYNFWQTTVSTLLLWGNSYVLIKKDGDIVTGFEQLRDDQIMNITVSDDSSNLTYAVRFDDSRPDTWFDSSEILHFKLTTIGDSSNNQYFGKSPLMSLVPELTTQALSNQLITETLKNGISPSVMIKVPQAQIDKEAKDSIRDSFLSQTTGDNLGAPIVLDASAELQTLGISPEVTNFLSNIDFTKTQISKAFGINVAMINGDGDSQSSIDMVQAQYQQSLAKYANSIKYELSLKLGVQVDMASDITDDALVTRINSLVTSQVLSTVDANALLKQKGII